MEAATVCIKVVEELLGSDVLVEQAAVAEVSISHFVNGVVDESCGIMFGCFVGSEVKN